MEHEERFSFYVQMPSGSDIRGRVQFLDANQTNDKKVRDMLEEMVQKMVQRNGGGEEEVIAHIGTGYLYSLAVNGSLSSSSLALSEEKIWGNLKILQDSKTFSSESFEADVANVSSISVRTVTNPTTLGFAAAIAMVSVGIGALAAISGGRLAAFFPSVIIGIITSLAALFNAKTRALAINVQGKEYIAVVNGASDGEIENFVRATREVSAAARERRMERQERPAAVEKPASIKQKIEELADLRKNGLISEEEFNRLRQSVIEKY